MIEMGGKAGQKMMKLVKLIFGRLMILFFVNANLSLSIDLLSVVSFCSLLSVCFINLQISSFVFNTYILCTFPRWAWMCSVGTDAIHAWNVNRNIPCIVYNAASVSAPCVYISLKWRASTISSHNDTIHLIQIFLRNDLRNFLLLQY